MKKRGPYIPWYPSAIQADVPLNMVSLAAYGLWHKLLYIMHDAQPYGHLSVNGQVIPRVNLARMCGCTADEMDQLMNELEAAGIPGKTEAGVWYSRRMVRDHKRAETARNNGRGGGNPELLKDRKQDIPQDNPHTQTAVNPEVNQSLSISVSISGSNETDELGERDRKGSGETNGPTPSSAAPSGGDHLLVWPNESGAFREEWGRWCDHLRGRGQDYANLNEQQAALDLLRDIDPEYSVELLRTARTSGWRNFYFPDTRQRYNAWKKSSGARTGAGGPATEKRKATIQGRNAGEHTRLRDYVQGTDNTPQP